MPIESRIRALTSTENGAWRPRLFDLSEPRDREAMQELVDSGQIQRAHDMIWDQLGELVAVRTPFKKMTSAELSEAVADHLDGRSMFEYGTWVFYPWSRALVHVLPEGEYRELRSSRNRYKITRAEHDKLIRAKIGVVGLSVGLASAITLLMESVGGEYRLADFDQLALSNMNRLRTATHHIGVNKCVIAAREMTEIDPYVKIEIFEKGLNEENVEAFLAGNGPLDLVVEECDDLFMKLFVRERAREHAIPLIMETNERGMLDIERFDLEPDRPLLHGLVQHIRAAEVKGLSTPEKAPHVLRIIGLDTISHRMRASLLEIGKSITSWPQLASGVMLGGALTTHAARKILLGQSQESGRYFVDLDQLVRDGAASELPGTSALEEALRRELPVAPRVPRLVRVQGTVNEMDLRRAVAWATLAPSWGNAQPWKFVARGQRLFRDARVRCYADAAPSALDADGSLTYVGLGAAVETLDLAARAMGMRPEVQAFPEGDDPSLVCEVRLPVDEAMEAPELAAHIATRATSRKLSRREPIPGAAWSALAAAADQAGGRLTPIADPAAIREIAAIAGEARRAMLLLKGLHEELMGELRWAESAVHETRDGIDVATLGMPPGELLKLWLVRPWPVVETLGAAAGRDLGTFARNTVEQSSALALLTARGSGPGAFFRGGRALQRAWLTATSLGLGVHPLADITALAALLERGDVPEVGGEVTQVFRDLLVRYRELCPVGLDEVEVVLLRLHHGGPPTARALRKPVDSVLVFEGTRGRPVRGIRRGR